MGGPVFNRSVEGADNNPTPKGFGVRGVSNTEEGFGVIGLKDTTVRDEAERAGVYGDGGDSAGGNMTCVIALKLRDENGPKLALHVPLFPEAAFPGDTLSGGRIGPGSILKRTASMRWYAITSRTRMMDAIPTSPP
jgi:hypothetical protein